MKRATPSNGVQVAGRTGRSRGTGSVSVLNLTKPMYRESNVTTRAIARVIYLWHVAGCRQILRGAA